MVATTYRDAAIGAGVTRRWRIGRLLSLPAVTILLAIITLVLTIDAAFHEVAPFDVSMMQQVQRLDAPGIETVLHGVEVLTSSYGAVVAWAVMLVAFLGLRWWLAAAAVFSLPVGGLINGVVGDYLSIRTRPDGGEYEIARSMPDIAAPSFPSGHVMGAVMLYGLLFFLATRIANRALRLTIQTTSAAIILLTGLDRVWEGAHWPSDVLGAYTLGGLILLGIVVAYRSAEAKIGSGLPLVRAAAIEHDEETRHAHALTSIVYFNGDSVAKVYTPGFIPRFLYWLAFQARFAYIANDKALEAAIDRRNLAGKLTEYWFGERRVARATGIEVIAGRKALRGEFVEGGEPADREAAKDFLKELRSHFESVGLPTWQIDPRQPRAVDNALETPDGRYMIVDLESGLVSPLASIKTWKRAIRRGMAPIYDDIYPDITRAYVAENIDDIRAKMGDAWLNELNIEIARAERSQAAWHASEPRIWSRMLKGVYSLVSVATWRERVASGQTKATDWLNGSVDVWQTERRITTAQAEHLRAEIASPGVQAVLPHFGAHFIMSVFLRFPLGSIARFAWSLWGLGSATAKLFSRRIDRQSWKQAWDVHHPLVILISAIPGFGAFAYLVARPVRSNRLLMRVTLDAVGQKVPKGLYERSGMRRLVAGKPRPEVGPLPVDYPAPGGTRLARTFPPARTQAGVAYRSEQPGGIGPSLTHITPVAMMTHRVRDGDLDALPGRQLNT